MSIIVVCPGCLKSFKVSDKFAGRTGPCPNCKRTLKVPEKSEEVKVHAPEAFAGGGRSAGGKLITEPVAFRPAKLDPVKATLIVAGVLVVLAMTWLGGRLGTLREPAGHDRRLAGGFAGAGPGGLPGPAQRRIGTIPRPGTVPAFGPLRLGYVALWGLFALLAARGVIFGELWIWLFVMPPFALAGGLFAMAALDLEFGDAVFHYGFYLVATLLLRWAAGMKWIWDLSS